MFSCKNVWQYSQTIFILQQFSQRSQAHIWRHGSRVFCSGAYSDDSAFLLRSISMYRQDQSYHKECSIMWCDWLTREIMLLVGKPVRVWARYRSLRQYYASRGRCTIVTEFHCRLKGTDWEQDTGTLQHYLPFCFIDGQKSCAFDTEFHRHRPQHGKGVAAQFYTILTATRLRMMDRR